MKKESIISKTLSLAKNHYYILILLVLTLLFFHPLLGSSHILNNIHYINDMTFQSENVRIWLKENGALPLWTPFFYAGQPFLGVPEFYLFDLNLLYIFLFGNIHFAMNLAIISYFFIAGAAMYILANEITKNKHASFIAALLFMFNGMVQKFILSGHLNILESYAMIPIAFYFVYRALHSKNVLPNAVLASIFFAAMIHAGGIIFFIYTGLLVGSYMAWFLIGKNIPKRIIKTLIIGIILTIGLFGLSAIKLFPVLEFTELSSRSGQVAYQEYLGNPILLSDILKVLVIPDISTPFVAFIGFTGAILLILGFMSWRKKFVLYSALIIILAILLAAGTFAAAFFYNLPGFEKMRHIERALVLFVFTGAIVAAFGFMNLVNLIKKNAPKIKQWHVLTIVLIALGVELLFLQTWPVEVAVVDPVTIPTIAEMIKDPSDFRVVSYAMSTPIGASGYNYYMQEGIPAAKGGGGIWVSDYVQYLAVAQAQAPSRLFGVLNSKYVISDREIPDEGLTLVNEFDECTKCIVWEAYGPLLYQNENAIGRALATKQNVLLVGQRSEGNGIALNMLANLIDPKAVALIQGKARISDYTVDELSKHNALLLLTGSVSQADVPTLQAYVDAGGKILPNLIEGETSLSPEQIASLNIPEQAAQLNVNDISVNEFEITVSEPGWILLNERVAHFPGWKATLDGKEIPIHVADFVISAVYADTPGTIKFSYYPSSYAKGKIISIITAIIIILYLGYELFVRIRK